MKHRGLIEEQHLSQSLLEKLELVAKEQDSDVIIPIDTLPDKEKALGPIHLFHPFIIDSSPGGIPRAPQRIKQGDCGHLDDMHATVEQYLK